MNDQLSTLLREAAAQPPPDGWTPADTLATARRRVRRRRAAALCLSAAMTASVGVGAGAVATLPQHPRDRDGSVAGAPGTSLSRATAAVPGRDYTPITTVRMREVGGSELNTAVRGLLPGHELVADSVRGTDARNAAHGLLTTPHSLDFTAIGGRAGAYLGHDGTRLVYGPYAGDGSRAGRDHYQVYDTVARTWRALPADAVVDRARPGSRDGQVVDDGHVYVAAGPAGDPSVYTARLDGTGSWTRVAPAGAAFDVHAGVLATAVGHRVVLRTLSSGDTRSVGTGSDCPVRTVAIAGDRLLVGLACDGARLDRLRVLTLDGAAVRALRATDLAPPRVTDRWVLVGSRAGVTGEFAWSLADGRLLRLTSRVSPTAGSEQGQGATVLWQSPLGARGTAYHLATLR